MRENYYLPWKEALKISSKKPPITDMYAISAFGNRFAIFRQDFRFSSDNGLNLPRPPIRGHKSYQRDPAPESWWCWDATEKSGKDRLELIANYVKRNLVELGLISGESAAFKSCSYRFLITVRFYRFHSCGSRDTTRAPHAPRRGL
jgi:hypothetical protein